MGDSKVTPSGLTDRISIKTIVFSDGRSINLSPDSIVILCGPNNVGKSAALKEIKSILRSGGAGRVVSALDVDVPFDEPACRSMLLQYSPISYLDGGDRHYAGVGYSLSDIDVRFMFMSGKPVGALGELADFSCILLSTANRIADSDPPSSIPILRSAPKHPIHSLQRDANLANVMSSYFQRAFGQKLVVHFGGGKEVPLYVGDVPGLEAGEHPLSESYVERLESSTVPLHEQGDGMRSFASVMLRANAMKHPSIILVDEPEAFLHPPQARLLGEYLAAEGRANRQMFIATHSSDILEGALRTKNPSLIVVRMNRDGSRNIVSVLDNDSALSIANEPITRYSKVLDGVFHRRVVVCEAEADSAFYNAVLDAIEPDASIDVMFTHGNGKASLSKIAATLKALSTPVSIIVDIDVLNDEGVFKGMFEAVGGDWSSIAKTFRRFKSEVEKRQNYLKVGDVKEEVRQALVEFGDRDPLTMSAKKRIVEAVKQASPWDALKEAGRPALPSGQMIGDFDALDEAAKRVGIWIVPVGQLEGFCKSAQGGHGPGWLRNVLESRDLAVDSELLSAREFISRVISN